MVVITIIALLGAMILPAFQRVFAVQRNVHCQNNLQKIGQAYHNRFARGAMGGLQHSEISVITWQMDLLGYLSGSDEVFYCPEDPKKHSPAEDARKKLKQIYIEVFTSGTAGDYSSNAWDVPLDEEFASEWVWRLSEEQFRQLEATSGHGQNYRYGGYQAGADPTTYYFTFEDQGWHGGGDKDYWDIHLKIQVKPTEIVITPIQGVAGYNFSLARGKDGQDKEVLIRDLKQAAGKPYIIPGGFGVSSYGLNSMAPDLVIGGRKLLVVDYEKDVAQGSDYDDPDPWLEDPNAFPTKVVRGVKMPAFFRHFDKANVLMGDGSVREKTFDDISIYDDAAREKYWNPTSK
jgi:prepilin-type processing-associated H-X9-DG protein